MSLVQKIKEACAKTIEEVYKVPAFADDILVNQTKPEFEGNYTIVLFALVKQLKRSPEQLGKEIGEHLVISNKDIFSSFNVIKGFLNLTITDAYCNEFLTASFNKAPSYRSQSKSKVIVEYSSPNTNKPLHLGHLRNNFLGWSVAEILKSAGNDVFKTCIVNDRGIHICKSMIAWQLFSNGDTPESTGIKGDHFVGDYYVRCEQQIKEEATTLADEVNQGNLSRISEKDKKRLTELQSLKNALGQDEKDREKISKLNDEIKEIIRANTPVMQKAQQMLVDWENGKPEVISLWKKMNSWVYKGFDKTYHRIGSDFDKIYYESETYLLGKKFVEQGLTQGILFKKEDGSVWIDLTDEGLDEKLLLRKDGTSVYITQDLGLADEKYNDFAYDQSYYVIADEQNYHMKVLQIILAKLGKPYAEGIFHLSYGMVELPGGRMKSREGTVVDADDLIDEMVKQAENKTREKSKIEEFTQEELNELYETIALGALKFFLLKVDPKKKMVFNPEESIDFHGFTGPFIQYTYARLRSILRKESAPASASKISGALFPLEKELILLLDQYPDHVRQAAIEHNPSAIANYIYSVAKTCNSFYTEHKVLKAESEEKKMMRLQLCQLTATIIKSGMQLLGIRVPERM